MNNNDFIIDAQQLSYQIGSNTLLHPMDFQIKKGEHWLIYGCNGSGKTTLLSIIAGFRQHTRGHLTVFHEPFSATNILRHRQRISWVSSSFFDSRYRHEQVLDIVLSGKCGTYGLNFDLQAADIRRAKSLCKVLELENKIHSQYSRLSKGQRQSVLIARALMSDADILLLDEPCSGLDIVAKSRLMKIMEKLMDNDNLTVLYATHNLEKINDLFTKTMLLRNGRLFARGMTADFFTPSIMTNFLKHPITISNHSDQQITLKVGIAD